MYHETRPPSGRTLQDLAVDAASNKLFGFTLSVTSDYFRPDSCERRWDEDSCIEICIANELKKPHREWYAVGTKGEDCQEYTWRIVHTCERRRARR